MSKHTPGPWFVFDNGHCVGGLHPEQGTAGIAICAMQRRSPEEQQANARIIATAPEMLEALIQCRAVLRQALGDKIEGTEHEAAQRTGVLSRKIKTLDAIIAKATGEEIYHGS